MSETLYLFPDTNVFEQCYPLQEIDWSSFETHGEVKLIVSRPVQIEIDRHKNQGNDRLSRKARKASEFIRQIILSPENRVVVRERSPIVTVYVDAMARPAASLSTLLDYSLIDDQLVGIVQGFSELRTNVDARLLTNDTGPMASAKAVGVKVVPVPAEWLLPPEPSSSDKRVKALELELAKLTESAPRFKMQFEDSDGNKIERLELNLQSFVSLSDSDLTTLLQRLEHRFPQTQHFGSRTPAERDTTGAMRMFTLKEVYKPVSDAQINEYRQHWIQWRDNCGKALRQLAANLNRERGFPRFCVSAENTGRRPARDALITIRAHGDFKVVAPKARSAREKQASAKQGRSLPQPPIAPQGEWSFHNPAYLSALDGLRRVDRDAMSFTAESLVSPSLIAASLRPSATVDPNGFFYKPERWTEPRSEFQLECQQWRHGVQPELFDGFITFDQEKNITEGLLECQIHAENLSEPISIRIPVRIRTSKTSTMGAANALVDGLL